MRTPRTGHFWLDIAIAALVGALAALLMHLWRN